MRKVVATELRADGLARARHAFERDAQQNLAHTPSVKWRGINEIQPAVQCDADALDGFFERNAAKLCAERRRAEAEDGNMKVSFSETTGLHLVLRIQVVRQPIVSSTLAQSA